MCLAIVKPGGVSLPEEHLAQGWINNSDGGGFAYIEKGEVKFEKGFFKYQDWLAAYKAKLELFPNSPFLIHFRIASQGDKAAGNTHPFKIPGGAVIHKVDNAVGYNKLAFLYDDGKYAIIGEGKGEWVKGVWYSNGGYKPYKSTAYAGWASEAARDTNRSTCDKHGSCYAPGYSPTPDMLGDS